MAPLKFFGIIIRLFRLIRLLNQVCDNLHNQIDVSRVVVQLYSLDPSQLIKQNFHPRSLI